MRWMVVVLCGSLLLGGCSRQKVNEVSVFKYRSDDNEAETALKTMGNVVPWTVGGAVGLAVVLIVAAPGLLVAAAAASER